APQTMAGWNYRKIGGGDLHVAQSNQAHCEVELYRRAGLGWRPEARLRSTCAALEFHGPDHFAELAYVPWEAAQARDAARPGSVITLAAPAEASEPPGPGDWIETPRPAAIVALGLTYRAHAEETGSSPDPLVFRKDPAAWSPGGGTVLRPSSRRLLEAAAKLDPALPKALSEFGFMPAMLDYEVELGLLLRDGLDDLADLESMAAAGRVGLVLANDITARSLQILGEGQRERMDYWGAAKSQPGFAATGERTWVPATFDLDRWPQLRLEARVNGELRQDAVLSSLLETPRQMLTRVREAAGPLPADTLLLTGTPAGVAFSVPGWKRALGDRFLDRIGKLRAALSGFSEGDQFLRPGDHVEVRAGFLGGFAHVVASEPES
ncbi:MAG: fumarylacetoacetate hydrolase family protein, partial [Myxococcales bacterium]|nr:fumarylacetoacetate hydrolase family protein [Myxococcales bacterium]